jgi:hypothetical protein
MQVSEHHQQVLASHCAPSLMASSAADSRCVINVQRLCAALAANAALALRQTLAAHVSLDSSCSICGCASASTFCSFLLSGCEHSNTNSAAGGMSQHGVMARNAAQLSRNDDATCGIAMHKANKAALDSILNVHVGAAVGAPQHSAARAALTGTAAYLRPP